MLSEDEKKLLKIFKAQVAKEETEYFTVNAYTQLLYDSHKTVLNLITKLQKENEEKDKQIDLMAEHIVSSAIVDDTVCAIKCDCESDVLEDCSHEKMLNCTKQYFETKVKKGE